MKKHWAIQSRLAARTALGVGLVMTAAMGAGCAGIVGSRGVVGHPDALSFPARAFAPPEAKDYRRVTPSGVPVFIAEDRDFPLIDLSITIRTGAWLEGEDQTGLASLTASQMRAGGTEKMPPAELDEELEFLAASIRSFAGDTQAGASASCLSKDIDRVLELLFDVLKTPRFDEQRLALAKSRAVQGMRRRNDDTRSIERREWGRLMRGDDHFSTDVTTEAGIESITRDDLRAWHKSQYHPGNFVIAVSGDFDTEAMMAKLESHLGSWERRSANESAIPEPNHAPRPGVYYVNKDDVNQGRISIGHLGTTRDNPDRYALTVMNDILGGGGFTSRIMSRVRSDEGLAYSAYSRFGLGTYYDGVFSVSFQSKSESCARAAQICLDEIERIRTELVSAGELKTGVESIAESFPRTFATVRQIVGTFAGDEYTGRDPSYWAEYQAGIRSVTAEDVRRVARQYLAPEKLAVLAIGNWEDIAAGDADRPEDSFKNFADNLGGPTEIPLPDPMTMVYP